MSYQQYQSYENAQQAAQATAERCYEASRQYFYSSEDSCNREQYYEEYARAAQEFSEAFQREQAARQAWDQS